MLRLVLATLVCAVLNVAAEAQVDTQIALRIEGIHDSSDGVAVMETLRHD